MILIDSDHATFFKYPDSERGRRFIGRLSTVAESEVVGVGIVTIEERMRGWLAAIAKERSVSRPIMAYRELSNLFDFYQEFKIVAFDAKAASTFDEIRKLRLRVGTMDLKLASTALAHDALLLSANLSDFKLIPGLRVENSLD